MLINARPHCTLCCLHKHKCLPSRLGGLIKYIHISSIGVYEHFILKLFYIECRIYLALSMINSPLTLLNTYVTYVGKSHSVTFYLNRFQTS